MTRHPTIAETEFLKKVRYCRMLMGYGGQPDREVVLEILNAVPKILSEVEARSRD